MPVRYTIQHMQRIARENGGKCLSREYINDETQLKWMCRKGHTWDASYTIIRQGGWCMQCVKDDISNEKLEELQQIARKKGGKCLSEYYINNHTKLKWKCKEGHKWEATTKSVKQNHCWCPYCSGHAPRTIEDMQRKAQEQGGKCLSHKYINSQTKLLWQCSRQHKWQAQPNSIFNGSWCPLCRRIEQTERQKNDIAIYWRHAEKQGGKLLSTQYIGSNAPMKWRCVKGHVWQARGSQVLNVGTWCPLCAGKAKNTIEDMQLVAKLKGGKCLSKIYYNINTKLFWECKKGHRWKSIPSNILHNNTWCLECYNKERVKNLGVYYKKKI